MDWFYFICWFFYSDGADRSQPSADPQGGPQSRSNLAEFAVFRNPPPFSSTRKNVKVYTDRISGAKTSRPNLDRLLHDMRAGKIERLVCYKLDRLGRSLTHLALILDEMNRLRIPLICSSQGIDTSDDNPAGRLQLGVLMAVAEFERGIIRERTKAGLAAARERGRKLGRPATLSKRAGDVWRLKRKGLGVRAIARELGMPVSSVHAILKRKKR